ncbi:hypothetical protein J5Y09_11865 [Roseomonas sp. PWR1]|uniref:Uncharacterized protein n=1 Tax=Roseomonas nitratireducens TaxID=2820810 RepID=A0ABS4ATA7_9PROT|nr:hypothetical protein [Neoroseomonas nitratireducens]MBP0464605.1 hypothetical protein [Neoroseomonas nitratireducens]
MRAVARFWRGEVPLGESFWRWGVLGGIALNLWCGMGALWLHMAERSLAGFILGHAVPLPYNLLATVGIWRAAGRPDADPRWAGPARAAAVLGMAVMSLT